MKELPAGLIFDLEGALPGRPWWRSAPDREVVYHGTTWTRRHVRIRSDGMQVYDVNSCERTGGHVKGTSFGLAQLIHGEELLVGRGALPEVIREVCASIDQKAPLPFPGLRDGQQWYAPSSAEASSHGIYREGVFTLREYLGVRSQRWKFGDLRIDHETMQELAAHFFLLRDPLFPTSAPWGPP